MSGLLSMLSFKLMTIKMGEFKFFTIKLSFRADWVLWVITLHFLMYTLLAPLKAPLNAALQ